MSTPTEVQASHGSLVHTRQGVERAGKLAAVGGLGWIAVGALGVWDVAQGESGEGSPYLLFSIALVLAAALTVAAAETCTRSPERATVRRCGLGLAVVALASTLVAWAGPLWMTMLAITLVVLAVAAPPHMRTALVAVAAGHVAGIVVTIGAMVAEVGQQNSYGDYPAAAGLGICTAAAGSVVGLALLVRTAPGSAK